MDVLDVCHHIAHVSGKKFAGSFPFHFKDTDFLYLEFLAVGEESYFVLLSYRAVHYANISNGSAEFIEHRIENERSRRSLRIAFRRRNSIDDGFENFVRS